MMPQDIILKKKNILLSFAQNKKKEASTGHTRAFILSGKHPALKLTTQLELYMFLHIMMENVWGNQ